MSLHRLLLATLFWIPATAAAHTLSDSYLDLSLDGATLSGHWRIAVADLELAVGLDDDLDGRIDWGEIRQRRGDINQHVFAHLDAHRRGTPCELDAGAHQIVSLNAGPFVHIPLNGSCPGTGDVQISYDFLFDIDSSHRGLLTWTGDQTTQVRVFSPDQQIHSLSSRPSTLSLWWTFLVEGVWHIWIGIDHILFLFALLVPIILRPDGHSTPNARSVAGADRHRMAMDVFRMVTAFTVAHSITLVIATLGWIELPSRLVESVIALSVAVSGLNILYPIFRGRHWHVAFVFGLIHGFGFASVLQDLSLPTQQFMGSLLSFNIGVEIGQLVIVLVLAPVLLLLGSDMLKMRQTTRVGSGLFASGVGLFWLAERSLAL